MAHSYLAEVRSLHVRLGLSFDQFTSPLLALATRGIKRSQAEPSRPHLPMTIDIITRICGVLPPHFTDGCERHMLWCAFTLAFFGFFCVGELTSPPNISPRLGDIWFHIDYLVVRLRSSRTDPFHHGCDVVVGASCKDVCAFGAAAEYLLRIRSRLGMAWERDAPLLTTLAGNALTRSTFSLTLKQLLASAGLCDVAQYSDHSFRIGAATVAGRQARRSRMAHSGSRLLEQQLFQRVCPHAAWPTAATGGQIGCVMWAELDHYNPCSAYNLLGWPFD